jgi:hypothetical protein
LECCGPEIYAELVGDRAQPLALREMLLEDVPIVLS